MSFIEHYFFTISDFMQSFFLLDHYFFWAAIFGMVISNNWAITSQTVFVYSSLIQIVLFNIMNGNNLVIGRYNTSFVVKNTHFNQDFLNLIT